MWEDPYLVEMIDQLSTKYLLNTFMVYLHYHDAPIFSLGNQLQVQMIDQLSKKYLLNTFMAYLDHHYAIQYALGY